MIKTGKIKDYQSHGSGKYSIDSFQAIGENVIIEEGVKILHPENIRIGSNVYIGHNTILKGYYKNTLIIGDNTWIGQNCFIHSAGGVEIGEAIGIGPGVYIITSEHTDSNIDIPVLYEALKFSKVILKDGCDIGVGTIVLPGVTIGYGVIVGAGSVVNKDLPDYCVAAGVPAKTKRFRK